MGGIFAPSQLKKQALGGLGVGKNEFNPLYAPQAIRKGFSGGGLRGFLPATAKATATPAAPRPDTSARDTAVNATNQVRLKKARNQGTAAPILSGADEGASI